MEKLLEAYNDAMSLERIIETAEKIKAYAARHPMSLCLITPLERAIYNKAILTITKIPE